MPSSLRQFLDKSRVIKPRKVDKDLQSTPKSPVVQRLAELQKCLRDGGHLTEAFKILKTLQPQSASLSSYERILLGRDTGVQELFKSLVRARLDDMHGEETPTLAQTLALYGELALLQPSTGRLHTVLKSALSETLNDIYNLEDNDEAARIIKDIFQIWKLIMADSFSMGITSQTSAQDWQTLPPLTEVKERSKALGRAPEWDQLYRHVFPSDNILSPLKSLSYQAVASLFCHHRLKKAGCLRDDFIQETKAFTEVLYYMVGIAKQLHHGALNLAIGRKSSDKFSELFGESCHEDWQAFRQSFRNKKQERQRHPPVDEPDPLTKLDSSSLSAESHKEHSQGIGMLFSNLRKASKEGDMNLLMKLWKRHEEFSEGKGKQFTQSIYAEFLWAFVKLVRIEKALEVWSTMQNLGVEPNMSHWTAMLEACRKPRDQGSLMNIWKQIQDSGLRVGNTAWTTYISILLHCRDWQEAVKTVSQLRDAWDGWSSKQRGSSTSDKDEEYKPTMVPINVTLSGLLSLHKPEIADSVLKFARERNLQPTVETFNILLKPAVRASNLARVQEILKELHESGCSPDIVTHTILIDGIFRNGQSQTTTQTTSDQHARIDQVFENMDASGIKATAHTYATILHSLLSSHKPNLPAASAVLDRMRRHNVHLSPHICSILVQHYFNADPPDLSAIDALWEHMEQAGTVADHIFFDRMVENYARLGATDKMLHFLRIMPKKGKLPGWLSLVAALKALAAQEDWGAASELVRSVEKESGYARLGVRRGWKGEEEFKVLLQGLRKEGAIMSWEEMHSKV
ncbi:MAG: hypothetical protein MMC23_000700 [Stictis urceolatum]|nr:hypothetical protein [Stictis urceolata]